MSNDVDTADFAIDVKTAATTESLDLAEKRLLSCVIIGYRVSDMCLQLAMEPCTTKYVLMLIYTDIYIC